MTRNVFRNLPSLISSTMLVKLTCKLSMLQVKWIINHPSSWWMKLIPILSPLVKLSLSLKLLSLITVKTSTTLFVVTLMPDLTTPVLTFVKLKSALL